MNSSWSSRSIKCQDEENYWRLTPDRDEGDAALCSPPAPLAWPFMGAKRSSRLGAGCAMSTLLTMMGTGHTVCDWPYGYFVKGAAMALNLSNESVRRFKSSVGTLCLRFGVGDLGLHRLSFALEGTILPLNTKRLDRYIERKPPRCFRRL